MSPLDNGIPIESPPFGLLLVLLFSNPHFMKCRGFVSPLTPLDVKHAEGLIFLFLLSETVVNRHIIWLSPNLQT